jgi:hypothetical protein
MKALGLRTLGPTDMAPTVLGGIEEAVTARAVIAALVALPRATARATGPKARLTPTRPSGTSAAERAVSIESIRNGALGCGRTTCSPKASATRETSGCLSERYPMQCESGAEDRHAGELKESSP